MRKYEHLPDYVQRAINAKERLVKAKSLAEREKPVNDKLDTLYHGKSSLEDDCDRREVNSWMELDEHI